MSDNPYAAPKPSKGDIGHALAKAGLSAVPVIGGSTAELFQLLVQPPLERRRAAWMERVAEGLKELEENGLKLDDLKENEEFTSVVMQASQIAIRIHQQRKLEALRNAVLNVATGQAPDDALQAMFLNFIDTFTEWHLAVLKFFQAPPPQSNMMGALSHVLENSFDSLKGRREFYDTLWRDLFQRGLVNTEGLHTMMSTSGLSQKRTTPHGDQFLAFIAEPRS